MKHISTETAFSNHIRECCNSITLYITKVVSTLSDETESALKDTMLEKDAFDLTNFSDVLNDTHEDEDTNYEESVSMNTKIQYNNFNCDKFITSGF